MDEEKPKKLENLVLVWDWVGMCSVVPPHTVTHLPNSISFSQL